MFFLYNFLFKPTKCILGAAALALILTVRAPTTWLPAATFQMECKSMWMTVPTTCKTPGVENSLNARQRGHLFKVLVTLLPTRGTAMEQLPRQGLSKFCCAFSKSIKPRFCKLERIISGTILLEVPDMQKLFRSDKVGRMYKVY